MAIINSATNALVYPDILEDILISSLENWFGDDEVIFQDDNASCQRAKEIKAFRVGRHIKSMILWERKS